MRCRPNCRHAPHGPDGPAGRQRAHRLARQHNAAAGAGQGTAAGQPGKRRRAPERHGAAARHRHRGRPPLHADLQASLAPWAGQPLLQATAELQALDLAALWPQAPRTRLSGSAGLEPADNGWRLHAALHNAEPAPGIASACPLTGCRQAPAMTASSGRCPRPRCT
jgi:hypothetical protein